MIGLHDQTADQVKKTIDLAIAGGVKHISVYALTPEVGTPIYTDYLNGIGFFREFFNIILPLIWPTVTTMVVFSMVGIFSNAGLVMLLCPDNAACHNIGYYILPDLQNK